MKTVGAKKKYLLIVSYKMKEKIIQFGSGNFLRGFADRFVRILNEKGLYDGKIVIVQPAMNGKTNIINEQNGKYNLFLRGVVNSREF